MILRVNLLLLLFSLMHLPLNADEKRSWVAPNLSTYSESPIEVLIGIQIDQISHVDQKAENFGVVGYIRMEWMDPNLRFEPRSGELPVRRYGFADFVLKSDKENIFFPGFNIHNQQGRRFSDDPWVVVFPEGKVVYGERFSATMQAPEFDFQSYPFDSQRFFVRLDTHWPESIMKFVPDTEFSGLGDQLGEEEWIFHGEGVETSTQMSIFGQSASSIAFRFTAHRHIWYYVLRILIPLLIIVMVSWATFFLQDFSKRVDISGGNLLVYIAFNFTISNDLPRLGYMTFMDTILAAAFIITGLTVVWNVLLRRLELVGKEQVARVIDAYTLWIYPFAFILVVFFSWRYFFDV